MEVESKVRDNVYKNTCPEVMISNLVLLGRVMGLSDIPISTTANAVAFIGIS